MAVAPAQWLDQPDRKPILVTTGDQCNPSIRAQRRIGVSLREANALSGKPVKRRSSVMGLTGAAEVGITAVVDDDEQDVRPAYWHPVGSRKSDPLGCGGAAARGSLLHAPVSVSPAT